MEGIVNMTTWSIEPEEPEYKPVLNNAPWVLERRRQYDEEQERRWQQNQRDPETRLTYDPWSGDWL